MKIINREIKAMNLQRRYPIAYKIVINGHFINDDVKFPLVPVVI